MHAKANDEVISTVIDTRGSQLSKMSCTRCNVTHREYIKSLPKRHTGCAVLIFNEREEVLIVKPNYKEGWSVPGGVIDALGSPHGGSVR